jgi:sugar lactone lactonase YvrE
MLLAPAQAGAFEWIGQYGLGSPGGGGGQVTTTFGIAVSPDGTVVASDTGNQRINVFAQSGRFLRAFGRDVSTAAGTGAEVCKTDCKTGSSGTGAGELNSPWGVAAGASEIYVAETANSRISAFDYEGHFLRAFGFNVGGPGINVCTSSCFTGTSGTAAGQLSNPNGIGLDAAGNLYVSNAGAARIDVFDPRTGQFLRAFGKNVGGPGVNTCTGPSCSMGTGDGTPGSVSGSFGVSVANGEVFVSEFSGNRVSVFATGGQFLRLFGSTGSGAGALVSPYGVAASPDGLAYVADTSNNRVSVFAAAGTFQRAFGLDVIPGAPASAEVCTIVCQAGISGSGIGEFSSPFAIAADCRGTIYVANLFRIDKFGEPGAATPPCPLPPPPAKPSNAFSFGKKQKNKKKGTLSVTIAVPGAGSLSASAGRKLATKTAQPTAASSVTITVKAAGKGVKALRKAGKLKGTLTVTFTPTGGDPATQTLALELLKQKKGKGKAGKAGKGGKGKGAPGA